METTNPNSTQSHHFGTLAQAKAQVQNRKSKNQSGIDRHKRFETMAGHEHSASRSFFHAHDFIDKHANGRHSTVGRTKASNNPNRLSVTSHLSVGSSKASAVASEVGCPKLTKRPLFTFKPPLARRVTDGYASKSGSGTGVGSSSSSSGKSGKAPNVLIVAGRDVSKHSFMLRYSIETSNLFDNINIINLESHDHLTSWNQSISSNSKPNVILLLLDIKSYSETHNLIKTVILPHCRKVHRHVPILLCGDKAAAVTVPRGNPHHPELRKRKSREADKEGPHGKNGAEQNLPKTTNVLECLAFENNLHDYIIIREDYDKNIPELLAKAAHLAKLNRDHKKARTLIEKAVRGRGRTRFAGMFSSFRRSLSFSYS